MGEHIIPARAGFSARGRILRSGVGLLLALTLIALTGCFPVRVPTPDMSGEVPGDDSAPPSGRGGGGEEEAEPAASSLDVTVLLPLQDKFCSWEKLDVTITVDNFDPLLSLVDEELMRSRGGQPVTKMDWSVQLGPTRHTSTTDPKPSYTHEKRYLGNVSGEVQVIVEVRLYVVDQSGQVADIDVARGAPKPLTIQIEKCPYSMSIQYEGEFQAQVWTRTESASIQDVSLTAPPDGPYTGAGDMTFTISQAGNPGGGDCATSAPWTGSSGVEVTGELDEESESLLLDISFQPGEATGGQMTCSAGGTSVTVPAEGGPIDTSAWPLASLEFPPDGGEQTVNVGQGVSGAGGAGAITIIVEPMEEEATS